MSKGAEEAPSGEQLVAEALVARPVPPVSELTVQDSYRLDAGDHLRIRFFDRFDRDDLNGDYVISESGQLRLPRLGVFDARQKTTGELERAIGGALESKGEKLGEVAIEIAQCRPFYVSGLANHPGSYPFVPGLTVIHAVSIAGGLYRSPMAWIADTMREKRGLTETLTRLAEREGAQTVAIPKELDRLEPVRATEMIDREVTVLQRRRDAESRERSWFEDIIALSKKEAEEYRLELERVARRIEEQTRLVDQLRKLHDEKIINQQRFFEAVVALDSVQRDKQLAIMGLSRADNTLEKAEHDLSTISSRHSA